MPMIWETNLERNWKKKKKKDFGQHFKVKLSLSILYVVSQKKQIHIKKEKELVYFVEK